MGCFEFAAQNYIEGTIIYYIDADPHQDMNLATFLLIFYYNKAVRHVNAKHNTQLC